MSVFVFCAPQASYLVGVSDPSSQSGHEGLVDPIQFARAHQAIQMACQNLVDPASSPSQVRSSHDKLQNITVPWELGTVSNLQGFAVMTLIKCRF